MNETGKNLTEVHYQKVVDGMARDFSEIEAAATSISESDDPEKTEFLVERIRLTAHNRWKELVDNYDADPTP